MAAAVAILGEAGAKLGEETGYKVGEVPRVRWMGDPPSWKQARKYPSCRLWITSAQQVTMRLAVSTNRVPVQKRDTLGLV